MSDIHYLLDADLSYKRPLPQGVKEYFSLKWLYQDLKAFAKPSPDQKIDLQKVSGKRVPIIVKSALNLPESCTLLSSAPALKPKIEVKAEMTNVFKES